VSMRSFALVAALVAALGAALLACGKKPAPADADSSRPTTTAPLGDAASAGTPGTTPTAPSTSSNSPASAPATPSAGGTVTTDFKPYNAFRAHAAKVLQVPPEQIAGGAVAEDMARRMPNTIGDALAYTMVLKSDPTRDVRGWAMLDGTVVTAEQNLGQLLAQAGVWSKTPTVPAGKLAEHLAWSYGMNHRVVIEPENGAPAPRYQLAADGTGTFRFFMASRPPGPGGAGGGPESLDELSIALSADHQAKLTKTRKR
jgi:hypothetical protein